MLAVLAIYTGAELFAKWYGILYETPEYLTQTAYALPKTNRWAAENMKSATSGAGREAKVGRLFAETGGSFKAYDVSGYRHQPEIEQKLYQTAYHDEAFVDVVPKCSYPQIGFVRGGNMLRLAVHRAVDELAVIVWWYKMIWLKVLHGDRFDV